MSEGLRLAVAHSMAGSRRLAFARVAAAAQRAADVTVRVGPSSFCASAASKNWMRSLSENASRWNYLEY
jgi:hypothetical protein